MTRTNFKAAAVASLAALALSATPLATAAPVSAGEASQPADTLTYLSRELNEQSHERAEALRAPTELALGQPLLRAGMPQMLRGASDLALWNLVATIHAQQKGRTFDLVDANIATVWEIEREQVSAVPLPGAAWLFVMSVLGLAGTRLSGSSRRGLSRSALGAPGATLAPA